MVRTHHHRRFNPKGPVRYMTSSQDKFELLLEKRVVEAGLDLINDRTYSNTGTFRITLPDSFAELAAVGYSFQAGYVTFSGDYQAHTATQDLGSALDSIMELTKE